MSDFQGTRCRLFIDEVGNGGRPKYTDDLNERFLSLTGIVTSLDWYETRFRPGLSAFKRHFFDHVSVPVILHRREVLRRQGAFSLLKNDAVRRRFDTALLRLLRDLPYVAFTVCLDKQDHLNRGWQFDPYHHCLEALVERYVEWMCVHRATGDVAIESRNRKLDRNSKLNSEELSRQARRLLPPT